MLNEKTARIVKALAAGGAAFSVGPMVAPAVTAVGASPDAGALIASIVQAVLGVVLLFIRRP